MGAAAAFGALAGAMLTFPLEAAEAARAALELWARTVAPVLGPFLCCMLMLTSRVRGGISLRLALGWLCGSPGGAKLLQSVHPQGPTALRCAALSGTMSPMFFLGAVGAWLGSQHSAAAVLLCHWLGAAVLGLLLPGGLRSDAVSASPLPFARALSETAGALLTVGLCMMLGAVSARMAACVLPTLPAEWAVAVQCALEVTSGVRALAAMGSPLAAPLCCAACSIGGLSLLMQNAAFWQESGVGPGRLLLLRLAHGLIAFCLCLLLTSALNIA